MGDKLRRLPALLCAMARKNEEADEDLESEISAFLRMAALEAGRSDPDGELLPVADKPGYLSRELSGREIFVPFNLASVVPHTQILNAVTDIAEAVRTNTTSPICISGSTTFLGAISEIGDLDYCEYYLADPAGLCADALRVGREEALPLACLKCGENYYNPPWPDCESGLRATFAGLDEKSLKLDFISNGELGVFPTSSVVLATRGEDGAAHRSFAYQEAVVAGGHPVRMLVRPDRFGAYVDWLCEQIRYYVEQDIENPFSNFPVKALKRSLSLMLITGYHDDADRIITHLRGSELSTIVKRIRLKELEALSSYIGKPASASLQEKLDMLRAEVKNTTEMDCRQALDHAREVARTSLELVELDIDAYA